MLLTTFTISKVFVLFKYTIADYSMVEEDEEVEEGQTLTPPH